MKLKNLINDLLDPRKREIEKAKRLDEKVKIAKQMLELKKISAEKTKEINAINIELEKLK